MYLAYLRQHKEDLFRKLIKRVRYRRNCVNKYIQADHRYQLAGQNHKYRSTGKNRNAINVHFAI